MNPRKYMIVDLEKKGDKRMFITEQVERISLGNNGLWTVVFILHKEYLIIINRDYYLLKIRWL